MDDEKNWKSNPAVFMPASLAAAPRFLKSIPKVRKPEFC
jgi:hypothetical protein